MKLKPPRIGRRGALTLLWWVGGLSITLTLVALSRQPALLTGDETRQVWEWFFPNLMPTLTLVGAAAYAGKDSKAGTGEGATLLFVLCVAVSLLYLYLLADAVLHLQSTTVRMEALRTSSLWLGPLQALATSLLGFFFVKPAADAKPAKPGGRKGREGAAR